MKNDRRLLLCGLLCLLVMALGGCTRTDASKADEDLLAHGHYLVHQVAMCIDCHSPRDATGAFVPGKELTGAALGFQPVVPMPWMPSAPGIAGLPEGYTEQAMVRYLMTGVRPAGLAQTLPPMPPYRMNQRDAEAVAAYLASMAR